MTASIKLAVFDCDGTIVDSQHSISTCMTSAFEAHGLAAPAIAAVRRVVGLPLAQAISVLAPDDAPIERLTAAYSDAWGKARQNESLSEPLFGGVKNVFDTLLNDGWLLGIATGKSMRGLDATLQHHDLSSLFVTLQTADRARGKPDPEMLEKAMYETGAEAKDTVMIGDTTYDIEMARNAGVRGIGVSWGYHAPQELLDAGAHDIADSMSELINLFTFSEEIAS